MRIDAFKETYPDLLPLQQGLSMSCSPPPSVRPVNRLMDHRCNAPSEYKAATYCSSVLWRPTGSGPREARPSVATPTGPPDTLGASHGKGRQDGEDAPSTTDDL